jgi:Fe-S-cluster containining protein
MNCKGKKESIFLTIDEAVRAICIDFRQYPPQTMLFAGIIPIISNNAVHLKRESGKDGAWINQAKQHNMRWMDGPELIDYVCEAISRAQWTPERMARICSRVFQTKVVAIHKDRDPCNAGVRIETNMETFSCHQCGNCCRSLDYHEELTDADVQNWKASGRDDLLKWVVTINPDDSYPSYRIWASPKTGRIVETCPFLKKDHTSNRWQCRIHDAKPGICRQYPTSRKHALMTGCLGFQPPEK